MEPSVRGWGLSPSSMRNSDLQNLRGYKLQSCFEDGDKPQPLESFGLGAENVKLELTTDVYPFSAWCRAAAGCGPCGRPQTMAHVFLRTATRAAPCSRPTPRQ